MPPSEPLDLSAIRARLRAIERRAILEELPRACVLVPLCTYLGETGMLFTKRTDTVGSHKGQVSFPGGRMDPDDTDEVACALRELEEELGVPKAAVDVLGLFHDARSINGMRVTPVVAWLGAVDLKALAPNPHEIDDVFVLSLKDLLDPSKREMRDIGPRNIPFFTGGPHVVWGLTAFILIEVLQEGLGLDVPPVS